MDERYLHSTPGGKWAVSRQLDERWVSVVQDSPLDNPVDAEVILRALHIPPTAANLDLYFPLKKGERCPTLDLLELCNMLDPTNPTFKKQRGEIGV